MPDSPQTSHTPPVAAPDWEKTQADIAAAGGLGAYLGRELAAPLEAVATSPVGTWAIEQQVNSALRDKAKPNATATPTPAYLKPVLQRPQVQELLADKVHAWMRNPGNMQHVRQFIDSRLPSAQGKDDTKRPSRWSAIKGATVSKVVPTSVVQNSVRKTLTDQSEGIDTGETSETMQNALSRPEMRETVIAAAYDWLTNPQTSPAARKLILQNLQQEFGSSELTEAYAKHTNKSR